MNVDGFANIFQLLFVDGTAVIFLSKLIHLVWFSSVWFPLLVFLVKINELFFIVVIIIIIVGIH